MPVWWINLNKTNSINPIETSDCSDNVHQSFVHEPVTLYSNDIFNTYYCIARLQGVNYFHKHTYFTMRLNSIFFRNRLFHRAERHCFGVKSWIDPIWCSCILRYCIFIRYQVSIVYMLSFNMQVLTIYLHGYTS